MEAAEEDVPETDYQSLHEFRYAIRRFLHFSDEAARAAGVEPQQHQLMLAIKGMPGGAEARVSDVAERLQIKHHSAVELVERLVSRGLATKRRADEDRREVRISLTAEGEEVLRRLSLHHRTELRLAGPALVGVLNTLIHGTSDHDRAAERGRTLDSR